MAKDINKSILQKLKETVDLYKKESEKVQASIDTIDEKYRKLAEKEKKDLNKSLSSIQSEIAFWEKTISSRYDRDLIAEVFGNASVSEDETEEKTFSATATVEEEVVVDSIFPENNENEEEEETENEEEPVLVNAELKEEEVTEESASSFDDVWPSDEPNNTESAAASESETTVDAVEEVVWPDVPEEW